MNKKGQNKPAHDSGLSLDKLKNKSPDELRALMRHPKHGKVVRQLLEEFASD